MALSISSHKYIENKMSLGPNLASTTVRVSWNHGEVGKFKIKYLTVPETIKELYKRTQKKHDSLQEFMHGLPAKVFFFVGARPVDENSIGVVFDKNTRASTRVPLYEVLFFSNDHREGFDQTGKSTGFLPSSLLDNEFLRIIDDRLEDVALERALTRWGLPVTCGSCAKYIPDAGSYCQCRLAKYCDKRCQKKGWGSHRSVCTTYSAAQPSDAVIPHIRISPTTGEVSSLTFATQADFHALPADVEEYTSGGPIIRGYGDGASLARMFTDWAATASVDSIGPVMTDVMQLDTDVIDSTARGSGSLD